MEYRLIRSPHRHRTLSLRVSPSGELIVRAPVFTPKFLINRFINSKSAWIAKQKRPKPASNPRPRFFRNALALQTFIHRQLIRYSALLELVPKHVEFKNVKSYWGNCSPRGVLRFNLQLQYAPPETVAYVVVHELVHLRYRGHGKKFWNLVTQIYPETKKSKKILHQLTLSNNKLY